MFVAALGTSTLLSVATPGAVAANGDPILAGRPIGETGRTLLADINKYGAGACDPGSADFAIVVCSTSGLLGKGTSIGVEGLAGAGGTGVYGHNTGSTGIGVWGQTGGTGSAVYGQATANGLGVFGVSAGGTGAQGQSNATNGTGVKGNALNGATAKGVWGVSTDGYGGYFEAPGNSGWGLFASGGELGVKGTTVTGSGVFGQNTGSTGIGVEGKTAGTGSAVYGHATANGAGVYGESETGTGTYGLGGPTGVYGSGTNTGVEGSTGNGGTGVYGHNSGSTGIGVWGQTGGTGSAVFGEATVNGAGVFGKSQTGSALRGDSPSGTALEVNGKAKFSRSGVVTVAAGTASKAVSLAGVTASSMVVATAQQNGSVFVKAAVPAAGSFTIFLNGNAPGSGLKVAYFVLN
jgi:hypothetical protein